MPPCCRCLLSALSAFILAAYEVEARLVMKEAGKRHAIMEVWALLDLVHRSHHDFTSSPPKQQAFCSDVILAVSNKSHFKRRSVDTGSFAAPEES